MRYSVLKIAIPLVLILGPSACAQKGLESIIREDLRLTFISVPVREPEVFGVGAIIQGRGSRFWPTCYTDTCLLAKSKLLRKGTIKISPFPIRKIQRVRISRSFFNFLRLGYKGSRIRYVEIEFVDPVQEDVDIVTAILIARDHLSPEGLELLFAKTKPRNEFVIMAVRCKRMILTLYDGSGREVMLPTLPPAGATWDRFTASSISLENVWFGMRTAHFVKATSTGTEPTTPVLTPGRPVHETKPIDEELGVPKTKKPQEYKLEERKPRKGFMTFTPSLGNQ